MGFHKRQKQKQTQIKHNQYVPEDYEHFRTFKREQQKIEEELKKKNLDIDNAKIAGLGQYIPKSYMEMMFRNHQQCEDNRKNFGTECLVKRVNNSTTKLTGDSNVVSRAEAMPR